LISTKDIQIDDLFWIQEEDIPLWVGKVIEKVKDSRTQLVMEDVTPDDKEPTWHQYPDGGAYSTRFINGFFGERFKVHVKNLTDKEVITVGKNCVEDKVSLKAPSSAGLAENRRTQIQVNTPK